MRQIGVLLWIFFSILGIGMITSCGIYDGETLALDVREEKEEEKTSLKILYSRDDITWSLLMDGLCSKFESENPDIDLEMQDAGNRVYDEDLKVKEALNEFPDIFEIQNVLSYVDNRRLGTIPESVSSLIEEPKYIEGKVYTAPLYTTTYGIIYNQVLFKQYGLETPKNYQDFLEICETLSNRGVVPIVCGGTEEDSKIDWLNYFYQKDVLTDNSAAVDFNAQPYVNMLTDYNNLINSAFVLKDSILMNDSQIISCLLSSEVAMHYAKPSFIANIILADPECLSSDKDNLGAEIKEDSRKVRLDWFFLPTDAGETIAATETGFQFAISKECEADSRKYKAAERFLLYLFEDENYRSILKTMYGFQTTKRRVLYPAPSVQQGLIIDYRYAQKEESFMEAYNISGSFKAEWVKALYLLANDSLTIKETVDYINNKWYKSNE